jgi:hypothetical protein
VIRTEASRAGAKIVKRSRVSRRALRSSSSTPSREAANRGDELARPRRCSSLDRSSNQLAMGTAPFRESWASSRRRCAVAAVRSGGDSPVGRPFSTRACSPLPPDPRRRGWTVVATSLESKSGSRRSACQSPQLRFWICWGWSPLPRDPNLDHPPVPSSPGDGLRARSPGGYHWIEIRAHHVRWCRAVRVARTSERSEVDCPSERCRFATRAGVDHLRAIQIWIFDQCSLLRPLPDSDSRAVVRSERAPSDRSRTGAAHSRAIRAGRRRRRRPRRARPRAKNDEVSITRARSARTARERIGHLLVDRRRTSSRHPTLDDAPSPQ